MYVEIIADAGRSPICRNQQVLEVTGSRRRTPARYCEWLLGRLARWHLRLSELNFVVTYKKGNSNNHTDSFSQLATLGETTGEAANEIPFSMADCSTSMLEPAHEGETNEVRQAAILIGTTTDTGHSDQLEHMSLEQLLKEQHTEAFCRSLRSHPKWE